MYKSDTKIRVRYAETDQMGVVHHPNYYVYFEAAREDFIAGADIRYRDMEEAGVMMPLVETQCRYIEGAKYDDMLIIETSLEKLTPIKVVLKYNVIREADKKIIARGKTTQAFVDKNSFRIINLKEKYTNFWEGLERLS